MFMQVGRMGVCDEGSLYKLTSEGPDEDWRMVGHFVDADGDFTLRKGFEDMVSQADEQSIERLAEDFRDALEFRRSCGWTALHSWNTSRGV